MLNLGPIAFAEPLFLSALVVLPVIWWLLRTTPPTPRRIRFPAIRLLFGLAQREETPARTPWWLIAMRMLLAAAIITALAKPILDPERPLDGSGPLLLVVDNGWAAASRWGQRRDALASAIEKAEREGKAVALVTTAPGGDGAVPDGRLMAAPEAAEIVAALEPLPWPVDRIEARDRVLALDLSGSVNALWMSDGLDTPGAADLASALQTLGNLRIVVDREGRGPLSIGEPTLVEGALEIPVVAMPGPVERQGWIRALDDEDNVVTRLDFTLPADEGTGASRLDLPPQRRNAITRMTIESENSAAAVVLLDERWQRRSVGLVSGRSAEMAQPLLSDLFYLDRALDPFSEVAEGRARELIDSGPSALILADVGTLTEAEIALLDPWIENGGVLIRFAGPRLAEGTDELVPVALRRGDRTFGGVLSWSRPARLDVFPESGPFAGLRVPDDVVVHRQVLAEPAIDLVDKTWARLTDGTPLVTGTAWGAGWIVLIHTTANNDWSTLPISGVFVDMLRRLVNLGEARTTADADTPLRPAATLDGFGRLGPAAPDARAIGFADIEAARIGPAPPPRLYGDEGIRRALNLGAAIESMSALPALPAGVSMEQYGARTERPIGPWLLALAFVVMIADVVASLALRGLLSKAVRPATTVVIGLFLFVALHPGPGAAQDDPFSPDAIAKRAALDLHLAYVLTGIPSVDDMSQAGLNGLSRVLTRRTSVEPADSVAVDVETDELAVFPFLYWPIVGGQQAPSPEAVTRLNDYLRHGGMILFDTREQAPTSPSGGDASRLLRQLVDGLDIPPLIPVPEQHVLTRSFYLLSEFPGRWQGGTVWVQEEPTVNDGVSPVIVGGHDWAGAWAMDHTGLPLMPVVPGGEEQREMAYRFGVNLIMYALTGNYKADQVHVPAIMERLGL